MDDGESQGVGAGFVDDRRFDVVVGAAAEDLRAGTFHGRGHIHHWEQFHYTLSAKYFDELRYDALDLLVGRALAHDYNHMTFNSL